MASIPDTPLALSSAPLCISELFAAKDPDPAPHGPDGHNGHQ